MKPQLRLIQKPSQPALLAVTNELELSLREYDRYLKLRQRSPGTREKYAAYLANLVGWLAERRVVRPAQLTRLLIREWAADLPEAWSPATLRLALAVARAWLGWLYRERLIEEALADVLEAVPVRKRIQRTLSAAEVQVLLDACVPGTLRGLRDAAIVSLMVDSGLRASELCRLRVNDVQMNLKFGEVKINFVVVVGKGGDENPAYFGQATLARLQAWLSVRFARRDVSEVFTSLGGITPGCGLTRFGLGDLLRKLGDRAGVQGVSPHALRRAFACLADEAGASSLKIQRWGRWSSLAMVERYTQALAPGREYPGYSPMDYLEKKPEQPPRNI